MITGTATDLDEIHPHQDDTGSASVTSKSKASSLELQYCQDPPNYDFSQPDAPLEPIIIRGRGNITIFGINNRFDREFPSVLVGKVAPEEFQETLLRINAILHRQVSLNFKWLLCGCAFCCCTFGCSFWPVVCLKNQTIRMLEKAIAWENIRLYNRIGLNLKLDKLKSESVSGPIEYVLVIQFMPKVRLLRPD